MDDAFLNAYFAIDSDMSGTISKDELVDYQTKNNYEDGFVNKWLKLFDRKNTGIITIEEFCDVLGLELKEVKAKHSAFLQASAKGLPDDVEVIYTDMTEDLQCDIFQVVLDANEKHTAGKDIVKYIKQELDSRYEKLWQTVMVLGQYWAYYSHEPDYSFIFKYKRNIYLIWRTPAP